MTVPTHDIILRFVDDLVGRVLSGIGEEHVVSAFVGGSVAGGEALHCDAGGRLEVYSDVDLYVVVGDTIELEEARYRGRAGAAEIPLEGPDYRFHRRPDVGVYTFDDLAAQPARPGTVGLDRNHLIVYGDDQMPARAADRIGTRISASESLYLLENRLSELAAFQTEIGGNATVSGYYAFVVCKTVLDAVSASLIVRGRYDTRRSERVRRVTSLATEDGVEGAWPAEAIDLARRCGERLDSLPSPDWTRAMDLEAEADAAVSLALDRWKKIAPSCVGGDPDDWADLVLRRCRTGDYLGNFRQFRAMNARCGFKRRGAVAAGIHMSRYSPIDALRVSAMVDFLSKRSPTQPDVRRLTSSFGPYLDRLTRECGFQEGSLDRRAKDMYRVVQ